MPSLKAMPGLNRGRRQTEHVMTNPALRQVTAGPHGLKAMPVSTRWRWEMEHAMQNPAQPQVRAGPHGRTVTPDQLQGNGRMAAMDQTRRSVPGTT